MKAAFLFIVAQLCTLSVMAQYSGMPGMASPQPAAFQPVALPGDHSTAANPLPAAPGSSASSLPATYQSDLGRKAQDRQQADALRAEVQETFSKPRISYALPSHMTDPGASGYLQAFGR